MIRHAAVIAVMVTGSAGVAMAQGAVELQARGVQIYACVATGDQFGWKLKAPEAVLLDASGREAGKHFGGPSWQASDGSLVTGEPIASSAGAPGSIPWLIVRATSHTGDGVFASVRYVVRSHTTGGIAPAGGCGGEHAGAEARVDYAATYTFFAQAEPSKP